MDEKSIKKGLLETGDWNELSITLGIQAGFKCEYCDRDLLASVNDYKEWQIDHIIPVAKLNNKTVSNDKNNLAVACRTCNFNLKGHWDPRPHVTDETDRKALIKVVREYIGKKRTEALAQVLEVRRIVYGVD